MAEIMPHATVKVTHAKGKGSKNNQVQNLDHGQTQFPVIVNSHLVSTEEIPGGQHYWHVYEICNSYHEEKGRYNHDWVLLAPIGWLRKEKLGPFLCYFYGLHVLTQLDGKESHSRHHFRPDADGEHLVQVCQRKVESCRHRWLRGKLIPCRLPFWRVLDGLTNLLVFLAKGAIQAQSGRSDPL